MLDHANKKKYDSVWLSTNHVASTGRYLLNETWNRNARAGPWDLGTAWSKEPVLAPRMDGFIMVYHGLYIIYIILNYTKLLNLCFCPCRQARPRAWLKTKKQFLRHSSAFCEEKTHSFTHCEDMFLSPRTQLKTCSCNYATGIQQMRNTPCGAYVLYNYIYIYMCVCL
jgi:hypothetical protein